jgi:hypothetical protein
MSKELVKRLRNFDDGVTPTQEAADCIEALTAKNEMLGREVNIARYGQPDFAWSVHVQVMDDLNAKLAKAAEALRAVDALDPEGMIDGCSHSALRGLVLRMGEISRSTLAEIEGEKK